MQAPTLVIHGEDDPLIQVSGGEATAKAVPGAKLVKIPGMGHDLPPELWPQFIDAIVENTERARARARRPSDQRPGRRVAFVSGAARGIGRAIALALAERGDAVAVGDLLARRGRGDGGAIEAAGGRAVALHARRDRLRRRSRRGQRRPDALGPIEILVNNAGWDELRPFLETDEEFWERVIDVNFKGCLRLTQAVLPGMIERGYGRVVNIGSDAGRVGSSLESVYSGAKGAVIAFTKTLAREIARDGRDRERRLPRPDRDPAARGIAGAASTREKVIDAIRRAVPMKRLGQPEEVAAAVAFLSSEEAGFITGQTLSVSGGLTMA